jgi:hypothetical protein
MNTREKAQSTAQNSNLFFFTFSRNALFNAERHCFNVWRSFSLSDELKAFVEVNPLLHEVTICLQFPLQDAGTLFVPEMSKQ